jgi:hypothetical protein
MLEKITHMFNEAHEIIGWVGMLVILVAYAGVSMSWITADADAYQVLNGVGAVFLIYSTYKTKSYPVLTLNIVWLLIAVASFVR